MNIDLIKGREHNLSPAYNNEDTEPSSANDYFPDINNKAGSLSPVKVPAKYESKMKNSSRNNKIKNEVNYCRSDKTEEEEGKKYLFSDDKIRKMLKIKKDNNSDEQFVKKKNLLEILFSVNYDKSTPSPVKRRQTDDQEYTPGFKNLVSNASPVSWKGRDNNPETFNLRLKQIGILDSTKNNLDNRGSSNMKFRDSDYSFSVTTEGGKSGTKQRLNRSQSYADTNLDNSLLNPRSVIKNRKYIENEDRTIKLREKLAHKKVMMKNKIKKKAIMLQKRHDKEKEITNNILGIGRSGSTFDASKQRSLNGPIESMNNNGLLQRISNNRMSMNELCKIMEKDSQYGNDNIKTVAKPQEKLREKVSRYL